MTGDDSARISIIIPCHNYGAFLADAIESALAQTMPPDEIIVVDDGSTDASPQVARQFIHVPGVRLLSQENRGAITTFNTGIQASSGEYFVLLSADDRLDPLFLERTVPVLRAHPGAGYVYTAYRMFGARWRILDALPFSSRRLRLRPYISATCLMRRAAYDEAGGFDQTMSGGHEDWAIFITLLSRGWTGIAVREVLLEYRKHHAASRNALSFSDWLGVRARVHRAHRHMYHAPRPFYLFLVVVNLQWLRCKAAPRAAFRRLGAKQHHDSRVVQVSCAGVRDVRVAGDRDIAMHGDGTVSRNVMLSCNRRRQDGLSYIVAATISAVCERAALYHATDAVGLIAGSIAAIRHRAVLFYEPPAALAVRGPSWYERLALLRCDALIAPMGEGWRRRWPLPPILVREGLVAGRRRTFAKHGRLTAIYRDILAMERATAPTRDTAP